MFLLVFLNRINWIYIYTSQFSDVNFKTYNTFQQLQTIHILFQSREKKISFFLLNSFFFYIRTPSRRSSSRLSKFREHSPSFSPQPGLWKEIKNSLRKKKNKTDTDKFDPRLKHQAAAPGPRRDRPKEFVGWGGKGTFGILYPFSLASCGQRWSIRTRDAAPYIYKRDREIEANALLCRGQAHIPHTESPIYWIALLYTIFYN